MRALARAEVETGIPIMGQIVRGDLGADTRERVAAFAALTRIGVPQQIETRPWAGDWGQFTEDELHRIVRGEHPEDVLRFRQRYQDPNEIIVERPEIVE